MMKILITGGTGLVGKALSKKLIANNHEVVLLSRTPIKSTGNIQYYWNPEKFEIDEKALVGVDCIIHLAGENVVSKKWTKKRKYELRASRVDSCAFLYEKVLELKLPLKVFISSSAVGWYGNNSSNEIKYEEMQPANDFLAQLCKDWERAADSFKTIDNCSVSKLRTGVIFSADGGAIPKMIKPILWGQGAALGTGKQFVPWIHIDDLCELYSKLVEEQIKPGVYNAVAPDFVSNTRLTKLMALALDKSLWMPNIPSWTLYMLLGKRASMLLNGVKVSSEKVIKQGFVFLHPTIRRALANILD